MDDNTREILRRIGSKIFNRTPSISAGMGPVYAFAIEKRMGKAQPPAPNETIAVAIGSPKTAALLYDRVWSPPIMAEADRAPESIAVYGATEIEILMQIDMLKIPPNVCDYIVEVLSDYPEYANPPGATVNRPDLTQVPDPFVSMAARLALEFDAHVTPVFQERLEFDARFPNGSVEVLYATFKSLDVVTEEDLSWEQVLEFRADRQAQQHYKRMLHWITADLGGREANFVADEIQQRLENYQWALRKHGITTAIGAVENIIDPKFLLAVSAATASADFVAGLTAAIAAGGGIVLGKLAIHLARGFLGLAETRRRHAEVAFIHDVKRLATRE